MNCQIFLLILLTLLIILGFSIYPKSRWIVSGEQYSYLDILKTKLTNSHRQTIPNHIYMTTSDKKKIPQKVFDGLDKYAKNIPFTIFDDTDCRKFLTKYYTPLVLNKFNELKGAHRADLFRYCLLFVKGGIYMDIKTKLIQPLDKILNLSATNTMYTVLSIKKSTIYQGIILTPPQNDIMLDLIKDTLTISNFRITLDYLLNTRHMYTILEKYNKNTKLKPGINKLTNGMMLYLLKEKCNRKCKNKDRYGRCCGIWDGNKKIIDTRFSDYPWK
jgi:hypothetical protein